MYIKILKINVIFNKSVAEKTVTTWQKCYFDAFIDI